LSGRSGYTHQQMRIYRSGAIEAAQLADDSELRHVYLSIARTWTELADKIERPLSAQRQSALTVRPPSRDLLVPVRNFQPIVQMMQNSSLCAGEDTSPNR
jgi:hypothetical protein